MFLSSSFSSGFLLGELELVSEQRVGFYLGGQTNCQLKMAREWIGEIEKPRKKIDFSNFKRTNFENAFVNF